jgi:hypothetical protein
MFDHPAAASNMFEMNLQALIVFCFSPAGSALLLCFILLYISARCVADAHIASSSMPDLIEQLQDNSCISSFTTLNIMSCLQWVMQLVTGGSEEGLGEMAAQAEQDVDCLIAMYAQVHSFLFYQHQ